MKVQITNKRKSIFPLYVPFEILKTDIGDYQKFENELFNSDSKIGIILGSRGSGKSAFGIKFLENLYSKTKKNCYAIGFNEEDMPSWINVVQDISQIKNNSFVLIDEGGVLFSSRDSMSRANKMLSDLILISRHKNLSILFISQNSANLDIDIIRQADYLIFKKSSLLQLDFERKKIQDIYKIINPGFEEFDDKYIAYIYSDTFRGFVKAELPSFWSQRISKSFANK
ncbi:MAG: zonular occludens toxin domain-containing protein [Candidatus Woesearchaeota archaeon]